MVAILSSHHFPLIFQFFPHLVQFILDHIDKLFVIDVIEVHHSLVLSF